ncbi:MAG: hypothetical protein DI551_07770 [Micavibrio aeruginosavorus]|uniref:Uncharacterized protein n=1 Tax=Micavibrio aeruginosavorus TaxID=349221 RepID=A0A2W5MVR6_9BACT|nr:MAG: hypothetical protein DI551_07770 [Micavibrio aeruginosavorus]
MMNEEQKQFKIKRGEEVSPLYRIINREAMPAPAQNKAAPLPNEIDAVKKLGEAEVAMGRAYIDGLLRKGPSAQDTVTRTVMEKIMPATRSVYDSAKPAATQAGRTTKKALEGAGEGIFGLAKLGGISSWIAGKKAARMTGTAALAIGKEIGKSKKASATAHMVTAALALGTTAMTHMPTNDRQSDNAFSSQDISTEQLATAKASAKNQYTGEIAKTDSHCSKEDPIFFVGERTVYRLEDPELCTRVNQAIPSYNGEEHTGQKVVLSGLTGMSVTAEKHKIIVNGVTKTEDVFVFRINNAKNVISKEDYRSIFESWLISGGEKGTPLPLSFLLAKWFLESKHGKDLVNPKSSARGANQFISSTFGEACIKLCAQIGYPEYAARFRAGGHRDNSIVYNNSLNFILGSAWSTRGAAKMQDMLDSGKMKHPDGGKYMNSTMLYIAPHLFGYERGLRVINAISTNPNDPITSHIPAFVYNRNKGIMVKCSITIDQKKHEKKSCRSKTLREFYDGLSDWGFDKREMPGLSGYKPMDTRSLPSLPKIDVFPTVAPSKDTKLEAVIAPGYKALGDIPGKPSGWLMRQYRDVKINVVALDAPKNADSSAPQLTM